jgi:hypothetical protein
LKKTNQKGVYTEMQVSKRNKKEAMQWLQTDFVSQQLVNVRSFEGCDYTG